MKLGFNPLFTTLIMIGYLETSADKDDDLSYDSDIIVKRFTLSDVDECDKLHIATLGHSRKNNLLAMLDKTTNASGIGYVARRTSQGNAVVAYTTSINTGDGHYVFDSLESFKTLFIYGNNDLKSMNNGNLTPQIWIPHQSVEVIRFLLAHGLKVRAQFTIMAIGDFKYSPTSAHGDGYQYAASAWY
jgi:hypothetical protein